MIITLIFCCRSFVDGLALSETILPDEPVTFSILEKGSKRGGQTSRLIRWILTTAGRSRGLHGQAVDREMHYLHASIVECVWLLCQSESEDFERNTRRVYTEMEERLQTAWGRYQTETLT